MNIVGLNGVILLIIISIPIFTCHRDWYVNLNKVQDRISCTSEENCILDNDGYFNQTIVFLQNGIASLESRTADDFSKVQNKIPVFKEELRMLKNNKNKLKKDAAFLAHIYVKDIEKYKKKPHLHWTCFHMKRRFIQR
jgi:hypothetical protein